MKQVRAITITGGRLVLPGEVREGALRLVDGRIAAHGDIAPEDGDEIVAAKGRLIAPGLVDYGVFAIDKPAFHFGGITRAALMPDQRPALDPAQPRLLHRQKREARSVGPPARRRHSKP